MPFYTRKTIIRCLVSFLEPEQAFCRKPLLFLTHCVPIGAELLFFLGCNVGRLQLGFFPMQVLQ